MMCLFRLKKVISVLLMMGVFQYSPAYSKNSGQKPWLGVAIGKHNEGVLVEGVMKDTPAMKAGLKSGDILMRLDASELKSPKQLIDLVTAKGIGASVTITYKRKNTQNETKVLLAPRPDQLELLKAQHEGKEAKPFKMYELREKATKPLDFPKGISTPVLVEFWQTWCPACNQTLQLLNDLKKGEKLGATEVIILSDEPKDVIENHIGKKYPNLRFFRTSKETFSDYFIGSYPTFFYVSGDGKVEDVVVGAGVYLEKLIQNIAKQK